MLKDIFLNKIIYSSEYEPGYSPFFEEYPYRITVKYLNRNMAHFWGNNCAYSYSYDSYILEKYLDKFLKCILSKGKNIHYKESWMK